MNPFDHDAHEKRSGPRLWPTSPHEERDEIAVKRLHAAEQILFTAVGLLLFVVGFILTIRSCFDIYALIVGPQSSVIATTANFLDLILLILMIAEIAYTVTLSVRGDVLSPMPFLIVGLIAVIRRVLVITVQEVQSHGDAGPSHLISPTSLEVALLTGVILVLVISMRLLARTNH